MVKIPLEKLSKEQIQLLMEGLNKERVKFLSKTEEPREIKRDPLGQFIGVGKLKIPEDHHGKSVNVVTIWVVQLRDDFSIKTTSTVVTFDELKKYRDCCNNVIENWK